jgi:hypothetical protein
MFIGGGLQDQVSGKTVFGEQPKCVNLQVIFGKERGLL